MIMSDLDDFERDEGNDARAGPSGVGNRTVSETDEDALEYTNVQALIDLTQAGFNGSGTTGLAQDDMELTSKNKWLVIDPSYYPKGIEDDFFFKLTDWSDKEHVRFTYGLLSGAKKYIISNSNKTSFASIINDSASTENKEFKMFSASIYAMSLVHMLAIDLHASLGTHFPGRIEGEVDDEEADRNFTASLGRHASIYDENAKNIREAHEAWVADRECAIARVRSALERRRETAEEEGAIARLRKDLITAHKTRNFANKNDVIAYIRTWILDNYPTVFSTTQMTSV